MHLQPMFAAAWVVGGGVSMDVFRVGLCLPSGSLTDEEADQIGALVQVACRR